MEVLSQLLPVSIVSLTVASVGSTAAAFTASSSWTRYSFDRDSIDHANKLNKLEENVLVTLQGD